MNNEEKAREIAISCTSYINKKGIEVYDVRCEAALQEMAEWKDERSVNAYTDELLQFKNILNRIRKNSGEIIDIKKSVEEFKHKLKGV